MPKGLEKVNYYTEKPSVNTKTRRCQVCKHVLSMYNLNKFCHVHALKGATLVSQEKQEVIARNAKKIRDEIKKGRKINKKRGGKYED